MNVPALSFGTFAGTCALGAALVLARGPRSPALVAAALALGFCALDAAFWMGLTLGLDPRGSTLGTLGMWGTFPVLVSAFAAFLLGARARGPPRFLAWACGAAALAYLAFLVAVFVEAFSHVGL